MMQKSAGRRVEQEAEALGGTLTPTSSQSALVSAGNMVNRHPNVNDDNDTD